MIQVVEISMNQSVPRHGPVGLAAATGNVLVGTLAAWVLVAQAGRGMLIGLPSVPLAPAALWVFYLASAS
ncbi:hypothetical protein B1R94_22990 [Mycolicibacterium litorale]|nr:hypothetical protein B1R94_22990 [Mycolicibacterium litorale]